MSDFLIRREIMNIVSIHDKELRVNADIVQFEHEIYGIVDMGETVIVLTMPRHGYAVINSIYGVAGGKVVWQIQDALEYNALYAPFAPDPYAGIAVFEDDAGLIVATSGHGFRFLVNPMNGKIIGTNGWVK